MWVRCLINKYQNSLFAWNNTHKTNSSSIWKAFSMRLNVVVEGLNKEVRDGRDTLFWTDLLLLIGSLINYSLIPLDRLDMNSKVRQY